MTTQLTQSNPSDSLIWSYLIHLSYNMWCDREIPERNLPYHTARPYLRCDNSLWNELIPKMANAGINMVIIDLGDGVQYKSHRDIAVRGAWTAKRLAQELARMRDLGIEPI